MVELGFHARATWRATVAGATDYQVHFIREVNYLWSFEQSAQGLRAWYGENWFGSTLNILYSVMEKEQVLLWWLPEVWNRAGYCIFGTEPGKSNDKLYDLSVAGVRAALPNAIVGGPASTGLPLPRKRAHFLDNFLKHCQKDARVPQTARRFLRFHLVSSSGRG